MLASCGMPDAPQKPVPVQGHRADATCPKCAKREVIEAFRHFATRVMFCMACEHSWTLDDAAS